MKKGINNNSLTSLSLNQCKIAIVAARFNEEIVHNLIAGARAALGSLGKEVKSDDVFQVAGCFEIPIACNRLARAGCYDAIVVLGAIIRGETSHYDHLCQEVMSGVMRVMLDHDLPIGFGVVMAENLSQAEQRSGGSVGNRGEEAAFAALDLLTERWKLLDA